MPYLLQVSEYRKKVDLAKNSYEPLDEGPTHATEYKFSYMKCDHANQHFVVHNVKGYLMQKVVNFIMNLRTTQHSFYLSRHGQSEYNNLGRIGGDSSLAFHGVKYAEFDHVAHETDGHLRERPSFGVIRDEGVVRDEALGELVVQRTTRSREFGQPLPLRLSERLAR